MHPRHGGAYAGAAPQTGRPTIPADKELYQRQIEASDRQIDALVYELHELMEEENAIVGRA